MNTGRVGGGANYNPSRSLCPYQRVGLKCSPLSGASSGSKQSQRHYPHHYKEEEG